MLQADDVIMADKGFNIQHLLGLHEARLMDPRVMRKNAVSSKASTAKRRIAKPRVHVERMIRKLKCFTILRGMIPHTMKPYVSSFTRVCAALVNLQPIIINNE